MRKRRRRPRPAPPELRSPADTSVGAAGTWAWTLAAIACAALVLLLASFESGATDVWQHLLVGKVIGQSHTVPTTQLWTWPTRGAPDVNPSWGFEALLYPLYRAWGVLGLASWRWWTSLAACALAVATARRLGASRGTTLLCAVLAAIMARPRLEPRPETLSAVLLAAFLWVLEERRQGGKDRTRWLVPLAWVWANTHLSWFLGTFAVAWHALAETFRSRREESGSRSPALWIVAALCLAVSFLNPFGWRALWEPFRFALWARGAPIFQDIAELRGLGLGDYWRELTPPLLLLWPILYLWRGARGRWDLVEGGILLACEVLTWTGRRFVIYAAFAMAPFLARALSEWLASLPTRWYGWARGGRAAAATIALAALAAVPALTRRSPTIGISFARDARFPAVCDFIERHDISGRMFNTFEVGGYVLWRFWPDRLPFMDVHQAGTPEDLLAYARALEHEEAWRELAESRRIDHVVLRRNPVSESLCSFLERDRAWALVFADDVTALYLRRGARFDRVIEAQAYRDLVASRSRLSQVAALAATDTALRARLRVELERMTAESADCAGALSLLGSLDMLDGRVGEARRHLDAARRVDPDLPRVHERLGILDLNDGHPERALAEFRAELRQDPGGRDLEARVGEAYLAMGDRERARKHFEKELARDPGNPVALAGLRRLELR